MTNGATSGTNAGGSDSGSQQSTGVATAMTCPSGASSGKVREPVFVRNIPGETGWFASPLVYDVDYDGNNEIIAAYYSLFVYDKAGRLLDKVSDGSGRIYAPHIVTDLDGDMITDIVFGNGPEVFAYEWRNRLQLKPGWPVNTTTANNPPEVRGLAAADLNMDGNIEVVATTTQTASTEEGGAQVFVFNPDGTRYQPAGISWQAWPRYNHLSGKGNDAERNGYGHHGYGCFGLNVGIGNIDDDRFLEIIVTYDNHAIQAFDHDGVAIDASDYFTNPETEYLGQRLTWGQFIRWTDPKIEEEHYHQHKGNWPDPSSAEWLQFTASPPNVVDLNGDGKNEVLVVPNVEMHEPYVTQAYAITVLEGSYGDGSRSAMRLGGWETPPRGRMPIQVDGDYPPNGIPAAAVANILGDDLPEIIVSLNDGYMYAFDAKRALLWRFNYTFGHAIMFASEPVVADLNQDGSPEVLFSTFGSPDSNDSGHLIVLSASGNLLYDVPLPNPGHDGNGNGAPAAPTVADLNGDGQLEVLVQSFDHGIDIFTVPGSDKNCLLWTTARGGPRRTGQPTCAR
jgi:hypothetical protein